MSISAMGLRCGNLLALGKHDVPTSILSIRFDRNEGYLINDIPESEFDPIPLTPEILEKCGLIKVQEGNMAYPEIWRIKYTSVLVETDFDLSSIDDDEYHWLEGNTNVPIYYLHQLQNLYFALTGEELKINL